MSYKGTGAYYTIEPGAIYGASGFGAIADTFNAQEVWADIQISNTCYAPSDPSLPAGDAGTCNAASKRATTAIQGGLAALGYSITVDGLWGTGTSAVWKTFMQKEGLPLGPGMGVTLDGLTRMQQGLKGGSSVKKASLATLGLIAVAGVGAIAVLALAKKKKGGSPAASGGNYAANRRRRR